MNIDIIPTYKLEDYFEAFQKPCIAFNMEYINHVPFYDSNKPHRHDYYQIIVLEKGTMKTKSNKIPAY